MLELMPISLKAANAYVETHHRHHGPVVGYKFAVGVVARVGDGHTLCGVGIAGRPVARLLDDGRTLEITRVCTNGNRNAPSMLYGALARAAFALGYKQVVTYTLCTESGASLRGAGWICQGRAGGGSWNRKHRPRRDKAPLEEKLRWERRLAENNT